MGDDPAKRPAPPSVPAPLPGGGQSGSSSEVDRYARLFADRVRGMRSSAMRDLMAITARPEIISLAGGLPDTSTFPPETFASVMTRVAHESVAAALQYGPTDGFEETKRCAAEVMAAEGMRVDPDDILITTGGQQGLDLVAKTLINPGDVILCEAPTYPGAIPTFSAYQAEVIQVDTDDEGMQVDLLVETIERLAAEGRVPKLIYSIPTFQNPAGVTLSEGRRRALVEVARSHGILVLEDNPYGLLRYEGEQPTPLYALDGGAHVIYLGTLSKILSPGIRLGWLVAPGAIREKLALGKQGTDLCTSTLTQFMVREYFKSERWRDYVDDVIEVYRARRDVMLDALSRHFPSGTRWAHPQGGMFVWATLPEFIDTSDLLARALRENVAFVPGAAAYVDGRGRSSMRLNFSGSDADEIREGVRRIGRVIAEQVRLYETLTGTPREPEPEPGPGGEILPLARRRRRS
ncbi:MAG: PLP-dependent aminotransferase family protein [Solirubrobacterales bacterium]